MPLMNRFDRCFISHSLLTCVEASGGRERSDEERSDEERSERAVMRSDEERSDEDGSRSCLENSLDVKPDEKVRALDPNPNTSSSR